MFKRVHLLFTLVAVVSAQLNSTSFSPQCNSALAQVAGNPDAVACLNIGGIAAIVTAPANTSLIPLAEAWISGICNVLPCQQGTIYGMASKLNAGCSKDQPLGSKINNFGQTLSQTYPLVRKRFCFRDNATAGQLCFTQQMTAFEKASGKPLGMNIIDAIVTGGPIALNGISLPKTDACSTCSKAVYTIGKAYNPGLFNRTVQEAAKKLCGDDFVDGKFPPTILGDKFATHPPVPSSAATTLMSVSPLQWFSFAAAGSLPRIMAVLL